ncbi:MAG: translation elongation factor Ts [Thermaerobacter sp.]|nr:translation elongation factor Ts [Thermaerobacter sp.]
MTTAKQVKELREMTGAGMMECKRALEETDGNAEAAIEWLRERGTLAAKKRADRDAREGLVDSYIHPGGRVGVLVEVNCETDFVARNDQFAALVHDVALHIAAMAPTWVERTAVPADEVGRLSTLWAAEAAEAGKPPHIAEKLVAGRLEKFYQEQCLLEQAFLKNADQTVGDAIAEQAARLGEHVRVRRFVRFERGL